MSFSVNNGLWWKLLAKKKLVFTKIKIIEQLKRFICIYI